MALAALLGLSAGAAAEEAAAFRPIALPSARSPSPVFNRFAALPPFTAELPRAGELFLAPSLEIAQAMIAASYIQEDGSELVRANLDFETIGVELPASFGISDRFAVELDLQLQFLWGGFLDGIIEGFHGMFGFPNGGRDLLEPYGVAVFVETENGYDLLLDEAALLLSDPYLGAAYRVAERPGFSASVRAGASVPLGLAKNLAGTELPCLAAGIYADWRPSGRLSVHALAGGILPSESFGWTGIDPAPMARLRLSGLWEAAAGIFLFLDLNLQTSAVVGNVRYGGRNLFGTPNADLLFGVAYAPPRARTEGRFASFAVQEDPVSHNSSDIRFIGSGAYRFR